MIKHLSDGSVAIICGPKITQRKWPPCWECGGPGMFMCDFVISEGFRDALDGHLVDDLTCDRHLCVQHRVNRGVEVDYCKDHVPE